MNRQAENAMAAKGRVQMSVSDFFNFRVFSCTIWKKVRRSQPVQKVRTVCMYGVTEYFVLRPAERAPFGLE
jgi:hypothetical protein